MIRYELINIVDWVLEFLFNFHCNILLHVTLGHWMINAIDIVFFRVGLLVYFFM